MGDSNETGGKNEYGVPLWFRVIMAEATAAAYLCFAIGCSPVGVGYPGAGYPSIMNNYSGYIWGSVILGTAGIVVNVSKAYGCPATALSLYMAKYLDYWNLAQYWLAQLVGSCFGFYLAAFTAPVVFQNLGVWTYKDGNITTFRFTKPDGYDMSYVVGANIFWCFIFNLTILLCFYSVNAAKGSFFDAMQSVWIMIFAIMPFGVGMTNPIVIFAGDLVNQELSWETFYWTLSQLIGATLAGGFWYLINPPGQYPAAAAKESSRSLLMIA